MKVKILTETSVVELEHSINRFVLDKNAIIDDIIHFPVAGKFAVLLVYHKRIKL